MKTHKQLTVFFLLYFILSISYAENLIVKPINPLIIDAEYSRTLDKIVSISSNRSRMYVFDPINNINNYVNLPISPTSLSVSPDGLFAVVANHSKIQYIDLVKLKSIKTIYVSMDIYEVILGNHGIIYAFGLINSSDSLIKIIDINTDKLLYKASTYKDGISPKLFPNGDGIYSSGDAFEINKYSIGVNGSVKGIKVYDDADFDSCGDLWFFEDGVRIIKQCGKIYNIKNNNINYYTTLFDDIYTSIKTIQYSKKIHQFAIIYNSHGFLPSGDVGDYSEVATYSYPSLKENIYLNIPNFIINKKNYVADPQYVFYSSDASNVFVIAQARLNVDYLNSFGVVTYKTGTKSCSPLLPNLDCDNDKILNKNDNCSLVFNPKNVDTDFQLDSDSDHYGDICDPDFNNDNIVNNKDVDEWLGLKNSASSWLSICGNPLYVQAFDFNDDCKINTVDNNIIMSYFLKKPGPSCIDMPKKIRGNQC